MDYLDLNDIGHLAFAAVCFWQAAGGDGRHAAALAGGVYLWLLLI